MMDFKEFIYIFEALSPEIQAVLEKSKFPVAQDLVAQAIKDLNDELDKEGKVITDKAAAFKLLRQKLGLEKKAEVPEPVEIVLKPFYKKLLDKQITLPEYKTAEYFQKSDPAMLNLVMQELRQIIATQKAELMFKNDPQLVFRGENFSDFKNIGDFAAKIHAIDSASNKPAAGFDEFRDPIVADMKHYGSMIWPLKGMKDNPSKIYIFKGDSFLKCKYFGKGAPWCVTKQPLHYYDYKTGSGQTQFFILDYNKAPNDPARYTNPGISEFPQDSEFVDLDNRPNRTDSEGTRFGINGHKGSKDYMSYLEKMGVPNPWELMKPDEVSEHEKEFAFKMQYGGNLEWARSKGQNVVKEYLEALGSQDIHLSEKDFDTLSNDEKYIYIVDTGLKPRNLNEADYLRSLSRKDYKEYLSNYEIDEYREEDKKYLKDLLLNIKSNKEPNEELLNYYVRNFLMSNNYEFDFIGAGSNQNTERNYPILYLKSQKNKDEFYRTDHTVHMAHRQILFPHITDQKTPIRAYNFIMSNLKELEQTDPDYLVNLIANDDLNSDREHSKYEYDREKQRQIYQDKKVYSNLKRMIFKNLDDEAKKRVLRITELYDEESDGERPDTGIYGRLLTDEKENLVKSLIRNIDDLKKIYKLIGKQPWMAEVTNVFKNLSKEDHDWVIKHIGKDPFAKGNLEFTQELARKHFKYADKIEDYTLTRYLRDAGLENTLQFLASNNYLDKIEDRTFLNLLTYSLERKDNDKVMETFLKYVPKEKLYNPKTILNFLLLFRATDFVDEKGKPNEYALKYLSAYLSHAEPSHIKALKDAIGNDSEIQNRINRDKYGFAKLIGLRNYAPNLVNALFSNLPPDLYKIFLQNANMNYLEELVTPEWLANASDNEIGVILNRVTQKMALHSGDTETSKKIQEKILNNTKPYSKKIIQDLAAMLSGSQIYSDNATEAIKPYLEKLPLDALKDYIVYTNGRDVKINILNHSLSPIFAEKIKQIPFEMFLDIFKSLESLEKKRFSEFYFKTHESLSDEQVQLVFDAGMGKKFLDAVWGLESLSEYHPDQFLKILNNYVKNNPDADKSIIERLRSNAEAHKNKKEDQKIS